MKLHSLCVVVALSSATPAWAAAEDEALVEKVAVRNRLFNTGGRFELGVNFGFAVLARLTDHYTGNLNVGFNIVDTFAVELLAGGSYTRHTSLARDVADQFATNSAKTADDLTDLWEMVANATLGVRWQPLYGKIGGALQDVLLGNPIHFQFYVSLGAGAGFFQRESLVICNHKTANACDAYLRETKPGVLFTLAGGLRLFLPTYGNHHSVRVEMRDFSYFDSYLEKVDRAAALNPNNPTGGGTPAQSPGLTNLVQVHIGYSYMF